jgi:hypothetical protein
MFYATILCACWSMCPSSCGQGRQVVQSATAFLRPWARRFSSVRPGLGPSSGRPLQASSDQTAGIQQCAVQCEQPYRMAVVLVNSDRSASKPSGTPGPRRVVGMCCRRGTAAAARAAHWSMYFALSAARCPFPSSRKTMASAHICSLLSLRNFGSTVTRFLLLHTLLSCLLSSSLFSTIASNPLSKPK